MTDRELLELAAKAAGIDLDWDVPPKSPPWIIEGTGDDRGPTAPWSPLADDGDALRLAAELKLDVTWTSDGRIIVRANRWDKHGVPYGSVIARATEGTEVLRRAIVEAAAQIGRACTSGETS